MNKYDYVSFSGTLRLDPHSSQWSQTYRVTAGKKNDYTLYGALPFSINLRRIKVPIPFLAGNQNYPKNYFLAS